MDFTLFDEGDVSEFMDQLLFNELLSEFTEPDFLDGESEMSSLTGSGSESEMGSEEGDAATLISTSGNWVGVRKPQNGYKLPGTDENLEGPNNEGLDLQAGNLAKVEKEVMMKFTKYLVRNWPSHRLNADLVAKRDLALADATAFWSALFVPEFSTFVSYLENAPQGNRSPRVSFSVLSTVGMINTIFSQMIKAANDILKRVSLCY